MATPSRPVGIGDILGLEELNQPFAPTFEDLLTKLWMAKYQGSVTLHFAGGLPRSVVLSTPIVTIALDTGGKSGP